MGKRKELLSVQEAAARLRITPQYVRKLMGEGKLEAERVGSQWVTDQGALERYMAKNGVIPEPDNHRRLGGEIPEIVALSFFSGAMGLDIGMAQGGIKALLACEINKFCRMTIHANEPEMALIGDINRYTAEEVLDFARIPKGRKVDVIFGGPPCQAFSTAGMRRALNDERGNVFLHYIDIISAIRPTYVVIENVRGLLSAPYPYGGSAQPVKGGALCVILDRLEAAGYTLSFELYNAANFGVPQIRERIIMIGKLGREKVGYLKPTHDEAARYGLLPWRTLREAFETIPPETEHHYIDFPEKRLKYYRMLEEGQYWKDLPPKIQVEAMGEKLKLGGGKTGFYRRLNFSRPSPTLVTNPTMPATDLCHPTLDRPLSVEEYAAIQEFPRDWKICGPILEQYRQIGNAVPIKLGKAVAERLLADMRGETFQPEPGYSYSRYKGTSEAAWEARMTQLLKKARAAQPQEGEQLSIDALL